MTEEDSELLEALLDESCLPSPYWKSWAPPEPQLPRLGLLKGIPAASVAKWNAKRHRQMRKQKERQAMARMARKKIAA